MKTIDEYEYIACGLKDCCPICKALDGKIFKVKYMESGKNAPPMHPNCHCATAPHYDDKLFYEWLDARQSGKTTLGLSEYKPSDEEKLKKTDIKVETEDDIDVSFVENTYGSTHSKEIQSLLKKAPKNVQRIWNKYQSRFATINPKYKGKRAYYSRNENAVNIDINWTAEGDWGQTKYQAFFHEFAHMIDSLKARDLNSGGWVLSFSEMFKGKGNISSNLSAKGLLGLTAKKEVKEIIKKAKKQYGVTKKAEACDRFRKEVLMKHLDDTSPYGADIQALSDLSDILEGAGIGMSHPFSYGHGLSYWKHTDNSCEIFAELFSASVANPKSLASIKEYLPETYQVFEDILEGILDE